MQKLPETINLQAILGLTAKPAVLIDRDYHIVATNEQYLETYGGTESSVVGRFCYAVSHRYNRPCDQAGETCPLKKSLETGHQQRVLHLHHTPRGEEHVDVETIPIKNDTGEIVYFLESMSHSRIAMDKEKHGLVGKSPKFTRMLELIERVAEKNTTVLLLGESGTGKELVAGALHQASKNSNGPFVAVECSGLTDSLFESEFYGYEKGSFTGANQRKIGLVEAAKGGTLFLDELGDIPLPQQVKLLRLLETGNFRRVGGIDPIKAEFRLICATHRNLADMVKDGSFRQDLYYRISAFPIILPSLRERRADIELLCKTLIERLEPGAGIHIHPAVLQKFKDYDFPGNIRELRNILERALILVDGNEIRVEHLPENFEEEGANQGGAFSFPDEVVPLQDMEEKYLRWVTTKFNGDNKLLAQKLGLSERTLYRKLEKIK